MKVGINPLSRAAARMLASLRKSAAAGVGYWTFKRSKTVQELAAAGLVKVEPHPNRQIKVTLVEDER